MTLSPGQMSGTRSGGRCRRGGPARLTRPLRRRPATCARAARVCTRSAPRRRRRTLATMRCVRLSCSLSLASARCIGTWQLMWVEFWARLVRHFCHQVQHFLVRRFGHGRALRSARLRTTYALSHIPSAGAGFWRAPRRRQGWGVLWWYPRLDGCRGGAFCTRWPRRRVRTYIHVIKFGAVVLVCASTPV